MNQIQEWSKLQHYLTRNHLILVLLAVTAVCELVMSEANQHTCVVIHGGASPEGHGRCRCWCPLSLVSDIGPYLCMDLWVGHLDCFVHFEDFFVVFYSWFRFVTKGCLCFHLWSCYVLNLYMHCVYCAMCPRGRHCRILLVMTVFCHYCYL